MQYSILYNKYLHPFLARNTLSYYNKTQVWFLSVKVLLFFKKENKVKTLTKLN
jgi:hypothetical protein